MNTEELKNTMKQLLLQANPEAELHGDDENLFAQETHVAPRDLVFVCMELKKQYPIDYNQVVDQVETYSLNQLAAALGAQLA